MVADFSGYATKAGLKCSDGRTITAKAFEHMDGVKVPLVWQHAHNSSENILGHAVLEARKDGVYAQGYFNSTPSGQNAKLLVQHGDIKNLSIYANKLIEQSKEVLHGMIREVSLVLSGANPGAVIDFVHIKHSDDPADDEVLADEAVIHTDLEIEVPKEPTPEPEKTPEPEVEDQEEDDEEGETVEHADDETVQDIYDSLTPDQKNVVHYMIGAALESAGTAAHSETDEEGIAHQEGTIEMRNVFEQNAAGSEELKHHTLSHSDVKGIVASAVKLGSLKEAVENYALQHGIENIDVMFPDAKMVADRPEWNKRRTEWVASVLSGTRKTPFARIKTLVADITQDEARAKGYVKGAYKLEEWFGVTKRTTTPTTIYKKQKLDRDDILDITDFDVVAFLKEEMRLMLEEEVARAVLVGDGRSIGAEDKIKDPAGASDGNGIRSILNDHELYVTTVYVNISDANSSYEEVVDSVLDGMQYYNGTGTPTFYTTIKHLNGFKKAKDGMGRRYYETNAAVAEALGVSQAVTVDAMNDLTDVVGIIVNLSDYNIGTDRGGEVSYFDDFDIDYNQMKYLMETRMSGALVKIKSAIVIRSTAANNVLVTPASPTFVKSTGVVTVPSTTGVVYKNGAGTTLTSGAQTALSAGAEVDVLATPAAGYYFKDNANDQWHFERPSA